MLLGRTGSAADAVTPGTPAQQYDDIPCRRTLADDRAFGSRAHDRADFHTFRYKTVVVVFLYLPGGQTDLVAVGRIPCRRADGQLALRQLACQRFFNRRTGIPCPGDAHGLIHISTAGQRISDGAPQTGSRAAEGFYFRWMVMGLVLEHNQPVFLFTVHFNGYDNGACIDFLRVVIIREFVFFL